MRLILYVESHGRMFLEELSETGDCLGLLGRNSTDAPEFGLAGTREELVQAIQAADKERELSVLAARVWRSIVEGAAPVRKPKY